MDFRPTAAGTMWTPTRYEALQGEARLRARRAFWGQMDDAVDYHLARLRGEAPSAAATAAYNALQAPEDADHASDDDAPVDTSADTCDGEEGGGIRADGETKDAEAATAASGSAVAGTEDSGAQRAEGRTAPYGSPGSSFDATSQSFGAKVAPQQKAQTDAACDAGAAATAAAASASEPGDPSQ